MPSPGASDIKDALNAATFSVTQTVAGETKTIDCGFADDAPVVVGLAAAIDAGWTSSSPATTTTMTATITAQFPNLASAPGLAYLVAIGIAIDAETALWVASWNSTSAKHMYAPSKATTYAKYLAAVTNQYPGVNALANAAIDTFIAEFDPAAG
jgi:hypothetical protein